MHTKRVALLLSASTCASMLLATATPAVAQSVSGTAAQQDGPATATVSATASPEPEKMGPGDIVVTARKRLENSNKVGMSISAMTGDTLAQQGITSVADLVKAVPGFNYTRSAYGAPIYTLRGIGFNETSLAAAPTVSVYVDEVPLPYSIMTEGAALDVQRVEVLKGPQGTLFGQNSTGGAINYIAAKPTKSLEAGFDLTVGRFDEVDTTAYISAPINDRLRFRLAIAKQYSGPWQISDSRPNDRLGKTDKFQGRLLVDWDATDRLSFELNANGWKDQSDAQAGQYVGVISAKAPADVKAQPISPNNARAADWDPGTNFYIHDNFWQTSLRGTYDFGNDITLTSITAYEKLTRNAYVDADGTPLQNFAALNTGFIKSFSQEVRLAGKLGQKINWVVGGNYQHDSTDDVFQPHAADSSFPFDIATAVGQNKVDTYAGFGNVDWEIIPTVTLTGGVRYTWQNRDYRGCLYDSGAGDLSAAIGPVSTKLSGSPTTIAPGACVTISSTDYKPGIYSASLDQGNVSWKVGANWQVDPTKLLYANVSKGYKNGVFITTGATFAAQLYPATQESVLAYEAGFKFSLFDHTLQFNGAAFYYDYHNKQIRGRVVDPVLGLLNKLINIPKSRIAGAELQMIWEPVHGLVFNGGATYVGSKILGNFSNYTPLGTLKQLSSEAFPLTPKWQLTGDLQYDFPVSSTLNFFIGGDATYQSKTNAALGEEPILNVKAYALADARIGIHDASDVWRLTGWVHNVANKYYWTNVVTNGPDVAIRYAGMPRTFGLTGSYRFR